MRLFRDLFRDERGNTAIIFGFAAIPLIALGGGTVDFAHRAQVRGELQSAVDTAAIAAARVLQEGHLAREDDEDALEAKATAAATRILDAALARYGGSAGSNFDVDIDGGVISISTDVDVPTSFLGVIGIDDLKAKANTAVNVPDPVLIEIAMVLDYSGSMVDDDKYIRMTDAARDFIGKVKKDRPETSKIGIVPFSEYVYTSIDTDDIRGWTGGTGSTSTCLMNRDYPYSATDDPASTGLPPSQWPQGDSGKCDAYATAGVKVHDLTDEFDQIDAALAGTNPIGLTNISLGMELGWHMLTPGEPYDTARDFSDENVQKVLILLTDGRQTVNAMGPSGDVTTDAANEVTTEVCENAKDAGIRVFAIAYDVTDPDVEALLSGCASGGANYFDASVSEIAQVFQEIYLQIAESVWLSR